MAYSFLRFLDYTKRHTRVSTNPWTSDRLVITPLPHITQQTTRHKTSTSHYTTNSSSQHLYLTLHNKQLVTKPLPHITQQTARHNTSTSHYTTNTTDKLPCPWRDSNTQSRQSKGRRPTPQTARSPGLAVEILSII